MLCNGPAGEGGPVWRQGSDLQRPTARAARAKGLSLDAMRAPSPASIGLGPRPTGRLAGFIYTIREALWGMFFYEFWHELREQRKKYEDALNVLMIGELLGIPLMNSTITLKLLPYLLPDIKEWKERQLEEFEILDHPPHIH